MQTVVFETKPYDREPISAPLMSERWRDVCIERDLIANDVHNRCRNAAGELYLNLDGPGSSLEFSWRTRTIISKKLGLEKCHKMATIFSRMWQRRL
jgi:hypothetical protein